MFKSFIKKLTHSPDPEMKVVQKQKSRSLAVLEDNVIEHSVRSESIFEKGSSQETVDSCESVKLDTPSSSVQNLFSSATDLDASSFSEFPQHVLSMDTKHLEGSTLEILARVVDIGTEFVKMLPHNAFNRQFVVRTSNFGEEPILSGWYVCKGVLDVDQPNPSFAQDPVFKASSLVAVNKSVQPSVSRLNEKCPRMSYHGFVLDHLHKKHIAWVFEEQEEMLVSLPDIFKVGDWFEYFPSTDVYTKSSTPAFESRQVDGVWQMLVPVVSPCELDAQLMDDCFEPSKCIWSPAFGPIAGYWPAAFLKNHFVNAWIARSSLTPGLESKSHWSFKEEGNQAVPSTTLQIANCFFAFPGKCFTEGIVVRKLGKTSLILSEKGEFCYCSCPDHYIGDHLQFLVWPMASSFPTINIAINCLVFCEQFLELLEVDEFQITKNIDEEHVNSGQHEYPGLGTIYDTHHLLHQGMLHVLRKVDLVVGFERLNSPNVSSPSFQWVIKRLVHRLESPAKYSVADFASPKSGTIDLSSDKSLDSSPIVLVEQTTPPKLGQPTTNHLKSTSSQHLEREQEGLFVVQKKGSRGSNRSTTPTHSTLQEGFNSEAQMSIVTPTTPQPNGNANEHITYPHISGITNQVLTTECKRVGQSDATTTSASTTNSGETRKVIIAVAVQITPTFVCLYSTKIALPKFLVPVNSFQEKPLPGDWFNLRVRYPILAHKTKWGNVVLRGVKAKLLREEPPLKTCLLEDMVVLMTEVSVGKASSSGLHYCYSLAFPLLLDSTGLLSDYKVGEKALAWCALRPFPLEGPVHWNVVALHSNKVSTTKALTPPQKPEVEQAAEQSSDKAVPTSPAPQVELESCSTSDEVGLVCSSTKLHYIVYSTPPKPNGIMKKSEEVKLGDWITFSAELVNGVHRITNYKLIEPLEKAIVTASQLLLPCEIRIPSEFKVSDPSGDKVVSDLVCPIYDSNKLIGSEDVGKRMKAVVACDIVGQPNQLKWSVVHVKSS